MKNNFRMEIYGTYDFTEKINKFSIVYFVTINVLNIVTLSRHTSTRKHIKRANGNDLETDFTADLTCKNTEFTCKHCNITCNKVSEWTRHVITKSTKKI